MTVCCKSFVVGNDDGTPLLLSDLSGAGVVVVDEDDDCGIGGVLLLLLLVDELFERLLLCAPLLGCNDVYIRFAKLSYGNLQATNWSNVALYKSFTVSIYILYNLLTIIDISYDVNCKCCSLFNCVIYSLILNVAI